MYYILYTSQATDNPAEPEFKKLLSQCRLNNPRREVTGLLLYYQGNYMQIIEGDEKKVKELYNLIYHDPRHNSISVLEEGEQISRNFPDWAMGFKAAAGSTTLNEDEYINLNENQLLFDLDGKIKHPALPHLKKFYEELNKSNG